MNPATKKVLLIEDDLVISNVLKEKLVREKIHVITAADGSDGLTQALAEHPDLILLDIVMPNMDGMTMLKKLREDSWGKTANVLVLTNLSDAYKAEEAAQKGVYDWLVKSEWQLSDLAHLVKKRLAIE